MNRLIEADPKLNKKPGIFERGVSFVREALRERPLAVPGPGYIERVPEAEAQAQMTAKAAQAKREQQRKAYKAERAHFAKIKSERREQLAQMVLSQFNIYRNDPGAAPRIAANFEKLPQVEREYAASYVGKYTESLKQFEPSTREYFVGLVLGLPGVSGVAGRAISRIPAAKPIIGAIEKAKAAPGVPGFAARQVARSAKGAEFMGEFETAVTLPSEPKELPGRLPHALAAGAVLGGGMGLAEEALGGLGRLAARRALPRGAVASPEALETMRRAEIAARAIERAIASERKPSAAPGPAPGVQPKPSVRVEPEAVRPVETPVTRKVQLTEAETTELSKLLDEYDLYRAGGKAGREVKPFSAKKRQRMGELQERQQAGFAEESRIAAERQYDAAIQDIRNGTWRARDSAVDYGKSAGYSAEKIYADMLEAGLPEADARGALGELATKVTETPVVSKKPPPVTEAGTGASEAKAAEVKAIGSESQLNAKAIRKYGVTDVDESVGYITRTGKSIDSSGISQGSWSQGRNIDHREIAQHALGDAASDNPTKDMIRFMNITGDVRVVGAKGELNFDVPLEWGMLSSKQLERLQHMAAGKKVYYDLSDIDGHPVRSGEGTFASFIKDLKETVSEKAPPAPPPTPGPKPGLLTIQAAKIFNKETPAQFIAEAKGAPEYVRGIDAKLGNPEGKYKWSTEKRDALWNEIDVKSPRAKIGPEADVIEPEIISKLDAAEAAVKERIVKRGTTMKTGVDPFELADVIELGAIKFAKGAVKYTEWSKAMIAELGDAVKPFLRQAWAKVQEHYHTVLRPRLIIETAKPVKFDTISGFKAVAPESGIREIERQITQIRREVNRGKVTQKAGKEAIKKLKEEITAMADDAGIAVVDGKPIIRQSGFVGDAELADAPIKDIYLRQSPLNTALTQDAAPRTGGKFGAIFRLIHEPTQKAEGARLLWERQQTQRVRDILRKNEIYGTGQKHHGKVMRQILETVPNEDLATLSAHQLVEKFPLLGGGPEHFTAAKQLRVLFDEWREAANQVRVRLGKKEIPYRETYAPHIEESSLWQTLVRGSETNIGDLPLDFIVPSQRINPHAYRRVGEMQGRELNLYKLIDSYIPAISRDIYLTPTIENIKAQTAVLKARGLNRTAQYWDDYIKYNLVRQPTPIDVAVGVEPGTKGYAVLQKIQEVRIRGGILGNVLWSVAVQPSSLALTVKEVGMRNTIAGARNWFFSGKLRNEVRQTSTSMQIKQTAEAGAAKQGILDEFSAGIYRSPMKSLQDLAGAFISAEEYHLHGLSIAAGLRHGRKLGYSGDNLMRYANNVGERTQSMYNAASRPMILQSQIFRTAVPFQTFAFEMWGHLAEIAGKTGMPANRRMRLGMAINLMVGIYLANEYGKKIRGTGSYSPSSFTPGIGPSVDVVTQYATEGKAPYQRIPIAPLEDARQLASGIYKFVNDEPGGGRELRRVLVLYGMGLAGIPGATQVNRTIDGLIAAEQGYWKSPSGRMTFPLDGAEAWSSLLVGPYGTQTGQEYIRKDYRPLSEKQTQKLERMTPETRRKAYENIRARQEWRSAIAKRSKP